MNDREWLLSRRRALSAKLAAGIRSTNGGGYAVLDALLMINHALGERGERMRHVA